MVARRVGLPAEVVDRAGVILGDVPRGTLSVDVVSPRVASVASLTKVTGVACALLDKGAITRSQYDREITSCTAAAPARILA